MSVTTLTLSAPANSSEIISQTLWCLDYVPFVSSGKCLVDIFLSNFWKPEKDLSAFSQAYYDHLLEKENFRYISAIPVLGNLVVIVQDSYNYIVKQVTANNAQRQRYKAEQGDAQAICELLEGTPDQRTLAIKCYCAEALNPLEGNALVAQRVLMRFLCEGQVEDKKKVLNWFLNNVNKFSSFIRDQIYSQKNIPDELRTKIIDVCIDKALGTADILAKFELTLLFKKENQSGKARIITSLQRAAEKGNNRAYRLIAEDLYYSILAKDPQTAGSLLQWIASHAENTSSALHNVAWETLNSYFYLRRDTVIHPYLKILQNERLPQEKCSFLKERLDTLLSYMGNQEQKTQIFSIYLKMAEKGKLEFMHSVGMVYRAQKNIASAFHWLDKAAKADHLPSILGVAELCENQDNLDSAIYWYEKAASRSRLASFRSLLLKAVRAAQRQSTNQQEKQRQRADFENNRRAQQESFERAREAERNRARQRYEEARRRNEQAQKESLKNEVVRIQQELEKTFGCTFSSKQELIRAWRLWSAHGGHPDKGGSTEGFQRVGVLLEAFKRHKGWL